MPLFDRSKGMSKWVFSNLLFKIIPGRSKYLLIEYLNSPSRANGASTFKFSLINSGRDAQMDIDSKWGRRDLFWHGSKPIVNWTLDPRVSSNTSLLSLDLEPVAMPGFATTPRSKSINNTTECVYKSCVLSKCYLRHHDCNSWMVRRFYCFNDLGSSVHTQRYWGA